MNIRAISTPIFSIQQALRPFLRNQIQTLSEGSILVIASKIVALSEGRVCSKDHSKDELVQKESECVYPVEPGLWLTYSKGHWCPNAGIDESNGFGQYVLWPQTPMETAWNVYEWLRETYGIKECGVIITDSRIYPARHGVTATALGYAGFQALRDYRGQTDLCGRPMQYTVVNVADALATAGALLMGEGAECRPLAVIEAAPVLFVEERIEENLVIDPKIDLFRTFLA